MVEPLQSRAPARCPFLVRISARQLLVRVLSSLCLLGCPIDERKVNTDAPDGAAPSGEAQGGASGAASGGSSGENGGSGSGVGGNPGGVAGTGDAGTASPDGGGEAPLPACADRLIRELGTATGATTNAEGSFSLSCGPGISDDIGFYWVAEAAGYYEINTTGSSFDTALGLLSPACDGTELACNDEGGSPPRSEILRPFGAGEGVVIVVDGKSGSFGDVALNVNRITCPAIDLGLQPLPLASTTLDGSNNHTGRCGGEGLPEKAYRWSAPAAGLYRFSVTSTVIEPALYVEQGPRCGGRLLGCNYGSSLSPAAVVRRLAQNEVVTLIVDSANGAGAFTLNVEELSSALCPSLPPVSLDNDLVTGTLTPGDPSVLTGSCVPSEQSAQPNGAFALPEHTYPLTTESGYGCSISINADAPVTVYVLEGLQCGGAELVCQNFTAVGLDQDVEIDLGDAFSGASYDYVVVVENTNPTAGAVNYTLFESCFTI